MNWKRNVLSYVIWFAYSLLTVCGIYIAAQMWKERLGGTDSVIVYGVIGGVLLLAGLLSVFVWRLRKKLSERTLRRKWIAGVLEILILLGIMTAGLLLRLEEFSSMSGAGYFEMATVKAGQNAPLLIHGTENLYVQILHAICFVLGNNLTFCAGFHLAVQMLAGLVCMLGIRALSGSVSEIVFAGFYYLAPGMIVGSAVLNPQPLFLFFFGIGLLTAAAFLRKYDGWLLGYVLTGAVIAGISYLDVSGLILLGILFTVLYVQREKAEDIWHWPIVSFLIALLSFAGALAGMFALDAVFSGVPFQNVISAWADLYFLSVKPSVNLLDVLLCTQYGLECVSVLLGFLSLGIFSFFLQKREERISVWLIAGGILWLFGFFGLMAPGIDGLPVFLLCLSALSGVAVSNYRKETVPAEGMRKWDPSLYGVEEKASAEEIWEDLARDDEEPEELPATVEETQLMPEKKMPKIGFVSKYLEEKRRRKEQQQRDIEKVLNALSSLSDDPLVSSQIDGLREESPPEKPKKEPRAAKAGRSEKASRSKLTKEKAEATLKEDKETQMQKKEEERKELDGTKPLHNPLPVPKKKTLNPLDYDYEVADDDDYDYDYDV